MHGHPPRLRAGRARGRGGGGARRASRQDNGWRSAQRSDAHGSAGYAGPAEGSARRHRTARRRGQISSLAVPPRRSSMASMPPSRRSSRRRCSRWKARAVPCTTSRCSAPAPPSCHTRMTPTPSRSLARGGGSLVASVYGEDRDFLARAVTRAWARRTAACWRSSRRSPTRIPATASSCRNAITEAPAAPATAPSWAASTACASITSAWRCRARPISLRRCRRTPRRRTSPRRDPLRAA